MRVAALVLSSAVLAGCQTASVAPVSVAGPPPAACELASFQKAPGQELVRPKQPAAPPGKSAPLRYADPIPLNRSIADTGTWVDAAPGWKAWRYYLHAGARSVSVHVEPLALPPRAEFWLCSPDRTTRQGPIRGDNAKYWSPDVLGPELWLEVLAQAGTEQDVKLTLAEAFAGAP